jgi:quinol monooxygenase YgiN
VSISRIGEGQAKDGLIEELRDFLSPIMPLIKSSKGCESVVVFQSQDDRSKFMMIEAKYDGLISASQGGKHL